MKRDSTFTLGVHVIYVKCRFFLLLGGGLAWGLTTFEIFEPAQKRDMMGDRKNKSNQRPHPPIQ